MAELRRAGGGFTRRAAALAAVVVAAIVLFGAAPASAQVPAVPDVPVPVPEAPEVPQPVIDAINQVNATVLPALSSAAVTLSPVAVAGGFALRAPCAIVGTAAVLLAIGGSVVPVPVSVGGYVVPVYIMCGYSYEPGPADPVFEQIDAAAGPTISEQGKPVWHQIGVGLAPYRENLSVPCSGLSLFSTIPSYFPPPVYRIPVIKMICGS